ncbi:MAG: aryl-sulfate sulfotransferase, partial [Bacteroidota bacterium]
MNKRITLYLCLVLSCFSFLEAQNTVGVTLFDNSQALHGYNLFFPHRQPNVFLMDNCGRLVHHWESDSSFVPGNIAYLKENGNVVIGYRPADVSSDVIWAGGGGATIEERDWDNNIIWSYTLNNATQRIHHDFAVMPNGNVLAIIWDNYDSTAAVAEGRDPAFITQGAVWPDGVIELEPDGQGGANIVWEWHAWDHLVQDFDSTKNNWGDVTNPGLIDMNFRTDGNGEADWHHCNALDYNAELDHIMLSCPEYDEIWIIDHSTTTAEAATDMGGTAGKGGNLIYRWGNPQAYSSGDSTDRQLFYQHDTHWMDLQLTSSDPNFGKIMLYNNQVGADYSHVNILNPVWNSSTNSYEMIGNVYGPAGFDWTYEASPRESMHSTGLSSAQRMKNGNTLITVG